MIFATINNIKYSIEFAYNLPSSLLKDSKNVYNNKLKKQLRQ